ncbi:hypothetical protein ACOMHN_049741 [Nucella lapillus]
MASPQESEEVKEVFDLFDFWDGRDGLIDASKLGDLLRCVGLNPTQSTLQSVGGTHKPGEKQYSLDQFQSIYRQMDQVPEWGTFREFQEAFKSFDREGRGYISAAECRNLLTAMGDRLSDEEVDEIMKQTNVDVDMDGNIKYTDFISKVMAGPPEADK